MIYTIINDYLTEDNLEIFLNSFFCDFEIIRDKKVPNSGINNRPDFRIEEIKTIIEFNGKFHYTNPKSIITDTKKKLIYESMGYKVIEIPYWIQLRAEVIYHLFYDYIENPNELKDYNNYPHGFQSKNCPLPASFCNLGIQRLNKEKLYWNEIIDKFYKYYDCSLLDKILELDSFYSVANFEIIPYFKDFFFNNGRGFGYEFDHNEFEGINFELEFIK